MVNLKPVFSPLIDAKKAKNYYYYANSSLGPKILFLYASILEKKMKNDMKQISDFKCMYYLEYELQLDLDLALSA